MKKLLLSMGFAALALSASAEVKTYFTEDFEWIEPWCVKNGAVDWINQTNDLAHQAIKIFNVDENDVKLYDKFIEKGYDFVYVHHSSKSDQEPAYYVMMQKNYLKFGTTGYNSGIVLPSIKDVDSNAALTISFDWMPMRQGNPTTATGTRVYDATQLVVVLKNGDTEEQVAVPEHGLQKGEEPRWIHADIALTGKTVTPDTKITIRQIDDQWPVDKSGDLGTKSVCRYFLDNIKLTGDTSGAAVSDLSNESAPVEYFNLQGVKVANPEGGVFIRRQGSSVTKVVK